ncbi:hypothetical protein K491DRAFT_145719 [Lophiostoma macrostomum CBS 122681]|uniref:Uncharacterized protein n=1 Tax=Lophiostoma macrostomum CBS 122681 TaxID=1314788 RepID=A0A6A6SRD7_9PLEO|nr:hypothetical protein K491DRAFT_145719 [Lophiostoma macrostomum CBS 122681]
MPSFPDLHPRLDSTDSAFVGSCPPGTTWYACSSGSFFMGCCRNDPCGDGCVKDDLAPVYFDKDFPGPIPSPDCGSPASFYICRDNVLPFWGCCTEDACNGEGCPAADLVGAVMRGTTGLHVRHGSAFEISTMMETETENGESSTVTDTVTDTGEATSTAADTATSTGTSTSTGTESLETSSARSGGDTVSTPALVSSVSGSGSVTSTLPSSSPSGSAPLTSTKTLASRSTDAIIVVTSTTAITSTAIPTTPSPSPSHGPELAAKQTSRAAIAGGVVAGVVGLCALMGIVILLLRRYRRNLYGRHT